MLAEPENPARYESERAPIEAKRILLAEDERELRDVLALGLRRIGYPVHVAATAADAHQLMDQTKYALVIVDWHLPDGNGLDVADRAAKVRSRTIVISGYAFSLPAGAADRHALLTKPIRIDDLIAAVQHRIGNPSA